MEKKTAISFTNVYAKYERGIDIISDASFNLSLGSFHFLSGISGAGKTTLLRLIYQLIKPTRGQIRIFGNLTNSMTRDEIADLRQKMAIVFQEYSLLSHLNVFDNVALPLRVRYIPESKIKPLVTKTLEWVGLARYANSYPLSLSGGQQQRVSVARAIITQPSILLADEPTGNLDDENANRLMELFIQMNKVCGTTIILATHNQKLMQTYKHPIIYVENHHVCFSNTNKPVNTIDTIHSDPEQSQNYFSELSKQFDEIKKM